LETFKSFESKSADNIQGRTEEDFLSRLNAAVTAVRGVNKTNVLTLGRAFGSAAGIMQVIILEGAAHVIL
jgi:DNA excision repair protein ERCC-1